MNGDEYRTEWIRRAHDTYRLTPARSSSYGTVCPRWLLGQPCTAMVPSGEDGVHIDPDDPCNMFRGLDDHTAAWLDDAGNRVVTWEPYPGHGAERHLVGLILWGRDHGIAVDVLSDSMWNNEIPGGTILIRFTERNTK